MKNFKVLLLLSFSIFFSYCQKEEIKTTAKTTNETPAEIPAETPIDVPFVNTLPTVDCTGECLFALSGVEGMVTYVSCYGSYAILTLNPEIPDPYYSIYGIPANLPQGFEEEGKKVIFSANFRDNTIPLQVLDPILPPDFIYEIDLIYIE